MDLPKTKPKSVSSIQPYMEALNLLYGDNLGDCLYSFADTVCDKAFAYEITASLPIILTTAMSPYNKMSGWYSPKSNTIEIVRQHCEPKDGSIVPKRKKELLALLAHELCHVYQYKALGGSLGSRGPHRCSSWYEAVTSASPTVCGVDIKGLCKPLKSVRVQGKVKKVRNEDSLSEPELTHWPLSIIELVEAGDPRLQGRHVQTSLLASYND